MKKSILSFGTSLTRKEQKEVMGGDGILQPIDDEPVLVDPNYIPCNDSSDCPDGRQCLNYGGVVWDSYLASGGHASGFRFKNNYLCEL